MKVSAALATRMSCRAFLPTPVPESTLRQILQAARRAPSGGNLQPWYVDAPINRLRSEQVPLEEFATFRGFV